MSRVYAPGAVFFASDPQIVILVCSITARCCHVAVQTDRWRVTLVDGPSNVAQPYDAERIVWS